VGPPLHAVKLLPGCGFAGAGLAGRLHDSGRGSARS